MKTTANKINVADKTILGMYEKKKCLRATVKRQLAPYITYI